jgi:ATP-dependent Zn protease
MILNSKRATAVHEAGHAVIGRVMAQECGEVTIVPDRSAMTAGYSITGDAWSTIHAWDQAGRWREYRSIAIGRIITMLAGRHAEEELRGTCEGADGYDQREIAMILDGAGWRAKDDMSEDPAVLLARLERFSRAAVRRHRKAIRALASELLKRKSMTADEVAEVLQPHLPRWHWPPRPGL